VSTQGPYGNYGSDDLFGLIAGGLELIPVKEFPKKIAEKLDSPVTKMASEGVEAAAANLFPNTEKTGSDPEAYIKWLDAMSAARRQKG